MTIDEITQELDIVLPTVIDYRYVISTETGVDPTMPAKPEVIVVSVNVNGQLLTYRTAYTQEFLTDVLMTPKQVAEDIAGRISNAISKKVDE